MPTYFEMRGLVYCAAAVLAAGCSKAPNLVGTWSSGLQGALTTYHFRPDGSFSMDTLSGGYAAHVDGRYQIDSGKLFLDPTGSDVQGAGPLVEQIKAQVSQNTRVTIQMNGPGSFRLGLEDPPLVVNKLSDQP